MLIWHHLKYKEIDGYDEIILITKEKHGKHHFRGRLNNIAHSRLSSIGLNSYETAKIAEDAYRRRISHFNTNNIHTSDFKENDIIIIGNICHNTYLFKLIVTY